MVAIEEVNTTQRTLGERRTDSMMLRVALRIAACKALCCCSACSASAVLQAPPPRCRDAATWKTIVAPAMAASYEPRCSRSAEWRVSCCWSACKRALPRLAMEASHAWRVDVASRTHARTISPCSSARRLTQEPRKPLAPVTTAMGARPDDGSME